MAAIAYVKSNSSYYEGASNLHSMIATLLLMNNQCEHVHLALPHVFKADTPCCFYPADKFDREHDVCSSVV